MKPEKPQQQDQANLFRSRLDQILNRQYPLFVLANQIDWMKKKTITKLLNLPNS